MRQALALMIVMLWAWGCSTSISPFPDLPGPGPDASDPGPDLSVGDLWVPSDEGPTDAPGDPGPTDTPPPTDVAGDPGEPPTDVSEDSGRPDTMPPTDVAGDPGIDTGLPPVDPCGPELNPQCVVAGCRTSDGIPGTCRPTRGGSCQCVVDIVPPQCAMDQDCVNRQWLVNCLGHWDCLQGTCREVCGAPCGDQSCDPGLGESPMSCAGDCPLHLPCQDNGDCPMDSWCARDPGNCQGPGVCQTRPGLCPRIYQPVCGCDGGTYENSCLAAAAGVGVRSQGTCPTQECRQVSDCLGRPWLVDCLGHWACSRQGACQAVCDFESCGDQRCDPQLGEDTGSCPGDCRADVCALQSGPFCLPLECPLPDGGDGRCGTRDDGTCSCGPRYGACSQDRDCIGQAWPIRCLGHWDCIRGACEPQCGGSCGNDRCESVEGEDRHSCSPDCPDRDTHCDDGSEPLCEMIPPRCAEGEILAYQNSCFVCVNPATCRPWGEPGCAVDADCPADQWCSPCGTSSCPQCDNCIPACVAHGCRTEPQALCQMVRPDCGEDGVAVVQGGCWVCVDRVTCKPWMP